MCTLVKYKWISSIKKTLGTLKYVSSTKRRILVIIES